jgi:multidrug efflux pump subunit AcrB
MSDVRTHVSRASLPTDAKTPTITELETNTNQIFSIYLYSKEDTLSRAILIDRAKVLQKELEKVV